MKTISRHICGALLGLSVLPVIVPRVRADETAEYLRRCQEERAAADRAYYEAQQEQAARAKAYYEEQAAQEARAKAYYEAQQEAEARDKAYKDAEQAQKERDEWHRWQEEERKWYENAKWQKEWDEWMGLSTESWDWAPSGQIWFQGQAPRQSVVILNPFVLSQKPPEEQEKVRKQSVELGQYIVPESQTLPQLIQNPFVGKPK